MPACKKAGAEKERRCTRGRAPGKLLPRPCLHSSFTLSLSLMTKTTTPSQTSKQDSWWAITKTDRTDKKTKQSEANSEENGYGLEVRFCFALDAQVKRPRKHRGGVVPKHTKCVLAFSFPHPPFCSAFFSPRDQEPLFVGLP